MEAKPYFASLFRILNTSTIVAEGCRHHFKVLHMLVVRPNGRTFKSTCPSYWLQTFSVISFVRRMVQSIDPMNQMSFFGQWDN